MALSIHNNTVALYAQRGLGLSGARSEASMQRLASGQRINNAGDDAAGLAISERMVAEIRGNSVAVRNVNDGISILQTAEGTATNVVANLQRIRELAVQAANGTLSDSDRLNLQKEAAQLFTGSKTSHDQATYNGKPLFGAGIDLATQGIQVSASVNDKVQFDLPDLFAVTPFTTPSYTIPAVTQDVTTTISTPTFSVYHGGGYVTQPLLAGDLTINGTPIPASVSGTLPGQSPDSAWAIAQAINSASGVSGVTAQTSFVFSSALPFIPSAPGNSIPAGGITINGVSLPAISGATMQDTVNDTIAKVNALTASTGVTAHQFISAGTAYVSLYTNNGRNLDIQEAAPGNAALALIAPVGVSRGGVILRTTPTPAPTLDVVIGGNAPGKAGLTAGTKVATYPEAPLISTVTTTVEITPAIVVPETTVYTVTPPDVSTQTKAVETLTAVDRQLDFISKVRSDMGAALNRFDSIASNLGAQIGNLSSSRGRIVDADYAQETSQLSAAQIMSQSSTAMLAQANAQAKLVLSLLNA